MLKGVKVFCAIVQLTLSPPFFTLSHYPTSLSIKYNPSTLPTLYYTTSSQPILPRFKPYPLPLIWDSLYVVLYSSPGYPATLTSLLAYDYEVASWDSMWCGFLLINSSLKKGGDGEGVGVVTHLTPCKEDNYTTRSHIIKGCKSLSFLQGFFPTQITPFFWKVWGRNLREDTEFSQISLRQLKGASS